MQENHTSTDWQSDSWQNFPVSQQPKYPRLDELYGCIDQLRQRQGLVQSQHIQILRQKLVGISRGEGFFIQAGDCAEPFQDSHIRSVFNRIRVLIQMAALISTDSGPEPLIIGRIAGQYFKPRSQNGDPSNPNYLCPYRGDGINDPTPSQEKRIPDPKRLLAAYDHSKQVLQLIETVFEKYQEELSIIPEDSPHFFSDNASSKLSFMIRDFKQQTEIQTRRFFQRFKANDFFGRHLFTSHEGLHLAYEQALTASDRSTMGPQGLPLNLGAHFLWIGDRTRLLNQGHVEYFRGIHNPIGIKVGPTCDFEELCEVIHVLNPLKELGRLTLICRFGAKAVRDLLPKLIGLIQMHDLPVIWAVDPMHGNILNDEVVGKTRNFNTIVDELKSTFEVHHEHGTHLGGVHLEISGDHVTECIGGFAELSQEQLGACYKTLCDPRLNYSQSLELALILKLLIAKFREQSDFGWRHLHPNLSL